MVVSIVTRFVIPGLRSQDTSAVLKNVFGSTSAAIPIIVIVADCLGANVPSSQMLFPDVGFGLALPKANSFG